MRLKKGFTLAEILIVLMVIGVIATMTVPSMMKGVAESQLKAGYKKALNTIANFAAMERVSGALPSRANAENAALLYQALNNSLSVTTFAQQNINAGSVLQNNANYTGCIKAKINGQDNIIGTEGSGKACLPLPSTFAKGGAGGQTEQASSIWLVTEDNLAYTMYLGGAESVNCGTKQAIASQTSEKDAATQSCIIVVVDVNGLSKGPNTYETQGLTALDAKKSMQTLTGDQYKIYFGIDGATAGPRTITATGRIAADLK